MLTDIPGAEIFAGMIESLCDPLLLAVPLFILAANLMNEGKATDRLIDVGTALLGHRRGGLAYVNILVSMIFAGVTGSTQEDTVSVGKNDLSMDIRTADRKTAVGVTAASSTIGSVIPPSVSMVVFSTLVHVDTAELFLCGLLPGILLGLFMMAAVWILNRKKQFPSGERAEGETVKHLVMESLPALLTPVILIGGIVSGWFTVTEAEAMFACLYSLVTGIFFYGEIASRPLEFCRYHGYKGRCLGFATARPWESWWWLLIIWTGRCQTMLCGMEEELLSSSAGKSAADSGNVCGCLPCHDPAGSHSAACIRCSGNTGFGSGACGCHHAVPGPCDSPLWPLSSDSVGNRRPVHGGGLQGNTSVFSVFCAGSSPPGGTSPALF